MIVNVVVVVLIILFGFYYLSKPEAVINSPRNRKRYISIVSVILILQSGLRHVAVGADTYQYFLIFESVKSSSWGELWLEALQYYRIGIGREPGYNYIQKVVQILSSEYQVFLFFIAVAFFSSIAYFLYKNVKTISGLMLAFVIYSTLFYGFFSITGHRQTLATIAVLLGTEFIKNRKLIPFIVLIIAASTIHKSVLLFLPFYFIARLKFPRGIIVAMLLIFPVVLIYGEPVAVFLQNITTDYMQYQRHVELKPIVFSVFMVLLSVVVLIPYKTIINKSKDFYIFYNALASLLFFLPLVFHIHGYMRTVLYFQVFLLVLLPAVFSALIISYHKRKAKVLFIAILILIALYIQTGINHQYKFFWQEMELGPNYQ